MMINYHNKVFRTINNSLNGEVGNTTTFQYYQEKNIVTGTYKGGSIITGQLIALANDVGILNMRYQHINGKGEIRTGICRSTPQILHDGRIRLHEIWKWTNGDLSEGISIIEEVKKES